MEFQKFTVGIQKFGIDAP
jgi:magnesium-transporting ATPase (P-type)